MTGGPAEFLVALNTGGVFAPIFELPGLGSSISTPTAAWTCSATASPSTPRSPDAEP